MSSIQRAPITKYNDFYRNKHAHVQQETPILLCLYVHTKTGHVNSITESFMLCRCLNCVTKNPYNKSLIRNNFKQPFFFIKIYLNIYLLSFYWLILFPCFLEWNTFNSKSFCFYKFVVLLPIENFYSKEIFRVK